MSDHDIVNFCINIKPRRPVKPSHKFYLFNRTNLEGLRSDMVKFESEFMLSPHTRSVEDNWSMLKEGIRSAIDAHVPYKMTKRKPDVPWMTVALKRQIRKRERLLRLAKSSKEKSSHAWKVYTKSPKP